MTISSAILVIGLIVGFVSTRILLDALAAGLTIFLVLGLDCLALVTARPRFLRRLVTAPGTARLVFVEVATESLFVLRTLALLLCAVFCLIGSIFGAIFLLPHLGIWRALALAFVLLCHGIWCRQHQSD
jgi:hypothetical protein